VLLGWVRRHTGALLGLDAAVLYWWVGPGQLGTDAFVPLAQAFLDGRIYLIGDRPWLELVPRTAGTWFVPFPPGPALVLAPFALVFSDTVLDTGMAAGIAGGIGVWLMWLLLGRIGLGRREQLWLTVAFGFGTEHLYVATHGGNHLVAQAFAAMFLLAALILAIDRHWVLAAVALSVATLCRLPVAFAAPVVAWLAWQGPGLEPIAGARSAILRLARSVPWASLLTFASVLGITALLLLAYNDLRWGDPFDFGYARIVDVAGNRVLDEPWYSHGIESILYLPRGLYAMLLKGFDFVDEPPWLRPSLVGTAITFTMPAVFWALRAPWRAPVVAVAWLSAVLILVPDLLHGASGFSQFGYRFIEDALPILWLLVGYAVLQRGLTRPLKAALIVGVAVNLYALVALYALGFTAP
jgi:hypothetical protein